MNLLTINEDKLIKLITYFQVNEKVNREYPILLMNEETANILEEQTIERLLKTDIKTDKKCKMFFGCHIAIADWLPIGEVQLK